MKRNRSQSGTIVKDALSALVEHNTPNKQNRPAADMPSPSLAPSDPDTAELDQGPGGSYNPSRIFPQQ